MSERVEPLIIKAIVRHYHTAGEGRPYRGMLKHGLDEGKNTKAEFNKLFDNLPDGTAITITIETHDIPPNAEKYIWALVSPNSYARIPIEVYEKLKEAHTKDGRYTWNKKNYLTPLGYDNFVCTKCHAVTFDTDYDYKMRKLYLDLKEDGRCEKCARGGE